MINHKPHRDVLAQKEEDGTMIAIAKATVLRTKEAVGAGVEVEVEAEAEAEVVHHITEHLRVGPSF
jgi:hypothetical protein